MTKPILNFFYNKDRQTGSPVEVPPVLKNKGYAYEQYISLYTLVL